MAVSIVGNDVAVVVAGDPSVALIQALIDVTLSDPLAVDVEPATVSAAVESGSSVEVN